MIESLLAITQFAGFMIVVAWLMTGAAIWLRWGWVGVTIIYARRVEIDQEIERDLKIRTH